MITTQYFYSFLEDRELPIIPLLDAMLFAHYPIYFNISWQIAIQWDVKMKFFLNTLVLMHSSTIAHILCV